MADDGVEMAPSVLSGRSAWGDGDEESGSGSAAGGPRRASVASASVIAGGGVRVQHIDRAGEPWWRRAARAMGLDCCAAESNLLEEVGLSDEEVEHILMMVPFTHHELNLLVRRFLALDEDRSGEISIEEFESVPELMHNPLGDRSFAAFEAGRDQSRAGDEFSFREFLTALSVFSENGSKAEKMRFLFRLYDFDGDGFLSRDDLFSALARQVPDTFGDDLIHDAVERVFREVDAAGSGLISYRSFADVVADTDVKSQLLLRLT